MKESSGFESQYSDKIYRADGEISLTEILSLLLRGWKTIVFITGLAVAGGLFFVVRSEPVYRFATSIEIGQSQEDGAMVPVEPIGTTLAKLKNAYVPAALAKFATDGDETKRYHVTVKAPDDRRLIVLSSEGAARDEAAYKGVHQAIVDLLIRDHRRFTGLLLQSYRNDILAARNRMSELDAQRGLERTRLAQSELRNANMLAGLRDKADLLTSQMHRLDEEEALIRQHIAALRSQLDYVHSNRAKAVTEAADEADAMALLLINSQIEQTRERLSALETRLIIDLPNERNLLSAAIAANERDQADQQAHMEAEREEITKTIADLAHEISDQNALIRMVNARSGSLQVTRALPAPLKSVGPIGPRTTLVLALSLLLGGVAAVFSVFGLELAKQVRRHLRGQQGHTLQPIPARQAA